MVGNSRAGIRFFHQQERGWEKEWRFILFLRHLLFSGDQDLPNP
jgi:hypothetical protein